MKRRTAQRYYIDKDDFRHLRRMSRLSQSAAATLLGVTAKTIQNWEQGVSRIPYSAFKLLRILRGYELPDKAWQGWTVTGDKLNAPNGRVFDVQNLTYLEQVFSMARMWRDMYSVSCRKQREAMVVQFPSVEDGKTVVLLRKTV